MFMIINVYDYVSIQVTIMYHLVVVTVMVIVIVTVIVIVIVMVIVMVIIMIIVIVIVYVYVPGEAGHAELSVRSGPTPHGGCYGWKPSSGSNLSLRAFRVYHLVEIGQTVSCRAVAVASRRVASRRVASRRVSFFSDVPSSHPRGYRLYFKAKV